MFRQQLDDHWRKITPANIQETMRVHHDFVGSMAEKEWIDLRESYIDGLIDFYHDADLEISVDTLATTFQENNTGLFAQLVRKAQGQTRDDNSLHPIHAYTSPNNNSLRPISTYPSPNNNNLRPINTYFSPTNNNPTLSPHLLPSMPLVTPADRAHPPPRHQLPWSPAQHEFKRELEHKAVNTQAELTLDQMNGYDKYDYLQMQARLQRNPEFERVPASLVPLSAPNLGHACARQGESTLPSMGAPAAAITCPLCNSVFDELAYYHHSKACAVANGMTADGLLDITFPDSGTTKPEWAGSEWWDSDASSNTSSHRSSLTLSTSSTPTASPGSSTASPYTPVRTMSPFGSPTSLKRGSASLARDPSPPPTRRQVVDLDLIQSLLQLRKQLKADGAEHADYDARCALLARCFDAAKKCLSVCSDMKRIFDQYPDDLFDMLDMVVDSDFQSSSPKF